MISVFSNKSFFLRNIIIFKTYVQYDVQIIIFLLNEYINIFSSQNFIYVQVKCSSKTFERNVIIISYYIYFLHYSGSTWFFEVKKKIAIGKA